MERGMLIMTLFLLYILKSAWSFENTLAAHYEKKLNKLVAREGPIKGKVKRYRCIVEFVNVNDTQNEVEKSWEKVPPIYSATDGDTSTQPATDGEPSQGNIRSISVERKHLPSISFRRPHRVSPKELFEDTAEAANPFRPRLRRRPLLAYSDTDYAYDETEGDPSEEITGYNSAGWSRMADLRPRQWFRRPMYAYLPRKSRVRRSRNPFAPLYMDTPEMESLPAVSPYRRTTAITDLDAIPAAHPYRRTAATTASPLTALPSPPVSYEPPHRRTLPLQPSPVSFRSPLAPQALPTLVTPALPALPQAAPYQRTVPTPPFPPPTPPPRYHTTSSTPYPVPEDRRVSLKKSLEVRPIREKASAENCVKMQQISSQFGISDTVSWAKNNCLFLKVYAPSSTCEEIISFIQSCKF